MSDGWRPRIGSSGDGLGQSEEREHSNHRPWLARLLERPTKVAVIALANKLARMNGAPGERCREPVALAR